MSNELSKTRGVLKKPRILYLDMAYTMKIVHERELNQYLLSKEVGGYFDCVWVVHPFADVPDKKNCEFVGFKINSYEINDGLIFIEGESAYYSLLRNVFPINFLISQIRFFFYLLQLVKKENIAIVQSEEPYFGGIIASLIKMITGVPISIAVVANYDEIYTATRTCAFPRIFRWRWIEKLIEIFVFRYADMIIGVNSNNVEYAVSNGAKESKCSVVTFGRFMDRRHQIEARFRDRDELVKSEHNVMYLIYVGRLVEVKHPDDVVKAFSVVTKSIPSCELIMAGDGSMRFDLERLALDLNLENKIHFLGNVNQSRLVKLLGSSSAYLSPLTGGALIEAALAGLPVIAYDRDWQGEFVGDNEAGTLIPFRNWQVMGEAAVDLLNNPKKAEKLGNEARRRGLELTNLDKIYSIQRIAFDKVLSR
jgi:glycosyltransferase involved in cell wall biosynthesis